MAEQNSPVTEFEKCARLLVQRLDEGRPLNTIEQLSLENHFHIIHLAYVTWKRQQSVDHLQRSDI
ncbi:MAG TPA: hypothetical protein VLA67_06295 [Nitrospiraceae bacterium]|nr:hypothetical protein [Nitrospiraceae bacterium]